MTLFYVKAVAIVSTVLTNLPWHSWNRTCSCDELLYVVVHRPVFAISRNISGSKLWKYMKCTLDLLYTFAKECALYYVAGIWWESSCTTNMYDIQLPFMWHTRPICNAILFCDVFGTWVTETLLMLGWAQITRTERKEPKQVPGKETNEGAGLRKVGLQFGCCCSGGTQGDKLTGTTRVFQRFLTDYQLIFADLAFVGIHKAFRNCRLSKPTENRKSLQKSHKLLFFLLGLSH